MNGYTTSVNCSISYIIGWLVKQIRVLILITNISHCHSESSSPICSSWLFLKIFIDQQKKCKTVNKDHALCGLFFCLYFFWSVWLCFIAQMCSSVGLLNSLGPPWSSPSWLQFDRLAWSMRSRNDTAYIIVLWQKITRYHLVLCFFLDTSKIFKTKLSMRLGWLGFCKHMMSGWQNHSPDHVILKWHAARVAVCFKHGHALSQCMGTLVNLVMDRGW